MKASPCAWLLGLSPLMLCACAAQSADDRVAPPVQADPTCESDSEPPCEAHAEARWLTYAEPSATSDVEPNANTPVATDAWPERCANDQLPADTVPFDVEEPSIEYEWRSNGLGVSDRVIGSGPTVLAGATVTFDYVGYRLDGCVFDATTSRGPMTGSLDHFIPGLSEGMVGMAVGGRRRLFIPPALAYGEQGPGELIRDHEVLVFEVVLVELP